MARRPRVRWKRLLGALLLLAILLALLELNRFLPGTWPGGGGTGGFRERPVAGEDATRVRPARDPLPPWPEEGVRVVVLSVGGGAEAGAEVGPDLAGAPSAPTDAAGGVQLASAEVLRSGFVVRSAGGSVRHGPADPAVGQPWVVHLPPALPPGAARGEDGRLPAALGAETRLDVRFVDQASGEDVTVTRLRVRSPEGDVVWEAAAGLSGLPKRFETSADLARASLEVIAPDRPVAQVLLAALPGTLRLPPGRAVEVSPVDRRSQPVPDARVTVFYEPVWLGPDAVRLPEPAEVEVVVEAAGSGLVPLPADRPARLLVEAPSFAPAVVTVPAGGPVPPVVLEPGRRLVVEVEDETGTPLVGAVVEVMGSAEGLPVRRRTRSAAEGRVTLGGLPSGTLEVYAHAPGRAWVGVTSEASLPGSTPSPLRLRLVPGRSLRLVVESPFGLPLAGVHVFAVPEQEGEAQEVLPPDARPLRTGADGTVVLPGLRPAPYRIRLAHPGYEEATLRGLSPGPGVHYATLLPRK